MSFELTALLILAILMMGALLIIGGLVLSARAFTQLVESLHFLGSMVEQQITERQHQQTASLTETERDTSSAHGTGIHTMPDRRA